MLKESVQAEKKRPQLETRKLQNGKFHGKAKQIVKVRNNPHTNISKPVTVRGRKY